MCVKQKNRTCNLHNLFLCKALARLLTTNVYVGISKFMNSLVFFIIIWFQVVSQYSSQLAPIAVDAVLKVIDPATATNVDLRDIKLMRYLGSVLLLLFNSLLMEMYSIQPLSAFSEVLHVKNLCLHHFSQSEFFFCNKRFLMASLSQMISLQRRVLP